jgi:tetratricopeptide (TPR) repeat protein
LNFAFAQQKPVNTDSLRKVAFSDMVDTTRVDALLTLIKSQLHNQPDTVLNYIENAKTIIDKKHFVKRYIGILSAESIISNNRGEFQKSLNLSNEILNIIKDINYPFGEAAAHLQRGSTLFYIARYEDAIQDFLKAYDIAKKIENNIIQIKAINNAGSSYMRLKKIEQAENIYKQGLTLAKKNNVKEDVGSYYLNLGTVYSEKGNYGYSLKYLDSAQVVFNSLKNRFVSSLILSNKAYANKQLRNYDLAIEQNLKALADRKEIGDKAGITRIYNNMGTIYLEQANWEKALEYTQLALGMAKEINRSEDIKIAYQNLA